MSCLVFFLYMISLLCVCRCSDDFLSTYRYKPGPTSPLSIDDPVQRIRQQNAIARFNDLFAQDRLDAMDSLLRYSDDYENNERIIFAAITVSLGECMTVVFGRIFVFHFRERFVSESSCPLEHKIFMLGGVEFLRVVFILFIYVGFLLFFLNLLSWFASIF